VIGAVTMEAEPLRIQEALEADEPRARLTAIGAHSLSQTDLLTILLDGPAADSGGNGQTPDVGALVRRLLTRFRSLRTLARSEPRELAEVEGLSYDSAVRLAAAFELGRRTARETIARMRVDSPEIVCQLLAQELRALTRESLRALLLDTKYQLLRIEEISLGSLNESIAHPREIFRPALVHSAYALIMVHNHPSGDPTPSEADRKLTRRLIEVGGLLQIQVLDHIIIGSMLAGKPSYFSFKEAGVIT
jgi:DNA repair protein RadC